MIRRLFITFIRSKIDTFMVRYLIVRASGRVILMPSQTESGGASDHLTSPSGGSTPTKWAPLVWRDDRTQ